MKKQIHPGIAAVLVVIVAIVAIYYVMKGMEPQRETQTMSRDEIYKQMQNFNQKLAGKSDRSAPAGSSQTGR